MPKVAVLPDHIASQIAAGEVVERPSSVIKELVENSIDAGATHIEVSVSHDMRDIRVADNGFGMDPEDAVLAFQRHATSKLKSADDLTSLSTLGFRGEALPSIASISKFTCYTRTKEATTGTRVEVKDGEVIAAETGCGQGTVMEIKDLFYNVPARLKFLKKAATEFGHAQEIVQSLAVAHPGIVFELRRADSVAFKTGGTGDTALAASEAKLFSGQEGLCTVSGSDERFGLTVTGIVARPNHFRGDRKGILSVVNQRPVRCPLTYKALEYAYSDLIPRGRHPFAVINIEIDPEHIDVNIHPTKKEIKYTDSNAIYMALHRAIGDALRQPRREMMEALLHKPEGYSESFADETASAPGGFSAENGTSMRPSYELQEAGSSSMRSGSHHEDGAIPIAPGSSRQMAEAVIQSLRMYSRGDDTSEAAPHLNYDAQTNFSPEGGDASPLLRERSEDYSSGYSVKSVQQLNFREELDYVPHQQSDDSLSMPFESDVSLPAGWRLAGYLHNTYFLFETPQGMEIIEQHIAHERLLYERILAGQAIPGRVTEHAQRLFISAPLNLTAQQIDVLKAGQSAIEKLGFEFEFSEDGSVSCLQVPLEMANQNYPTIIQKMIEDLTDVEAANIELEATKSIACQSAIKNGMTLSHNDIIKLVSAWMKTPRNDTCPHGRPVRLKFSMDKLFEMFHPA
jgi:DNA mismatch repair protein MutL